LTSVTVKDKMPVDIALRKLSKKLLKSGLVADVRKHMSHVSPLVRKKRKKLVAKRRAIRQKAKYEV